MTFSKKIVAITAVAASGVMGFDMNNMDASAGPDGPSASMGGMSVSAGPDGAKADMKDAAKSDTKTLSPAAKAAAERIPKDKTAEEIAELLKKEQNVCKDRNAEAMAKKMAEAFSDFGNMMNMTPGTDNSQASNSQGPRRQLFDMNLAMNMGGMQQVDGPTRMNMDGMMQNALPGTFPATEEMCLKQVKAVHAELCNADSATEGSYLNRFSCDDAITVCSAAGVDSDSMPQCMTSGAIAGTVIGVLLVLAIISGAAYYFLILKKKQQKNATNAEIDIERGSSTVTIKVAARRENGSTILTLNVDGNEPQKVCVQDNGSNTTCDTEKVSK